MPRFKLTIEYAGTRYSGWQIQLNARTVQGELERAIQVALSPRPGFEVYGAGRTDAGVHALAQVAHLEIDVTLPPESLKRRVNDELPADICLIGVEPVGRRFHARHDAQARSYLYQISRRRTAFAKPFVWWVKEPLDLAAMRRAADLLVGFGDFRSFTADEPDVKSTVVLVEELTIAEDPPLILVRMVGSHFLWKMVRRIVGVLAEVGRGKLGLEQVALFLRASSDAPARLTAPASGLFLERVYYQGDPRQTPLRSVMCIGAPERGPGADSA